LQTFVFALPVDKILDDPGEKLTEPPVPLTTKERLQPTFDMEELSENIMNTFQYSGLGIHKV
jgi:hypothetical protein